VNPSSWAIEQFAVPTDLAGAACKVEQVVDSPDGVSKLISQLLADGIVKEVTQAGDEIGRTFFTHISDFPTDRLQAPLGVECELTLRCMRRCTYCAYESSPDIRTSGELTYDDWAQILQRLQNDGVFYVRFTGGDPLTRPDSIAIARKASELGFGVSIASDLTVLSAQQAKELASLDNLLALQTTLDGPNQQVAESQRGPGNFGRVLQGLDLLQRAGVPVIVGTVVTTLNASTVGDIARLLSKYKNIIGYCVSPLYDAGRGQSVKHLIPSADDLASAYEQFAEAVARGVVPPADPAWEPLAATLAPEERRGLWSDQTTIVRSPDRLLRLDPLGRAYTSIHVKGSIGENVFIGNIKDTELSEMWNYSTVLNALRTRRRTHPYFGDIVDIARVHELKEVQDGNYER
jgi:MoaA/NifB/PqqE/SkfB family radical SAM enzyme